MVERGEHPLRKDFRRKPRSVAQRIFRVKLREPAFETAYRLDQSQRGLSVEEEPARSDEAADEEAAEEVLRKRRQS